MREIKPQEKELIDIFGRGAACFKISIVEALKEFLKHRPEATMVEAIDLVEACSLERWKAELLDDMESK
jgi:hypothetical protein